MFGFWTTKSEWAEICADLMDNIREEDAPFLKGYLRNTGANVVEAKHVVGDDLVGIWNARRPRLAANKTKSVSRKYVAYERRNGTRRRWAFGALLTIIGIIVAAGIIGQTAVN